MPDLKHTLKILDHVILFYDTSKQMEPIIRAGPSININGESRLQIFYKQWTNFSLQWNIFEHIMLIVQNIVKRYDK